MSLESDRRAIGARNEAERRAIGARINAERTASGQRIRADLDRTIRPERNVAPLPAIEPRGSRPAATGRGAWIPPASASGGGIDSPLTETLSAGGALVREYYPAQQLHSSDGIFVIEIENIKSIHMTDAFDAPVEFRYANPGA